MGCPTEDHWYIPYGTPGTMGQSQSVTSHLVGCPYRSKALSFNSYEKFIKLRVRKAGVTEVANDSFVNEPSVISRARMLLGYEFLM